MCVGVKQIQTLGQPRARACRGTRRKGEPPGMQELNQDGHG